MGIQYDDRTDSISVSGKLTGDDGRTLGEYTREINFKKNAANSDYFKLNGSAQDAGVGKQLLSANVAMYQKMGLDSVGVHADIDVGGYAWARYGYVPTKSSWRDLSNDLERKIDRMAGGGGSSDGFEASSWDELGASQQSQIERAFMSSTRDEFYDSEVQNWQDSGQALDDAKVTLSDDFEKQQDWAEHAIAGYNKTREEQGKSEIPFTDQQILDAVSIKYDSNYEGTGDLEIDFDDKALTEPIGHDPAQSTLPGIPTVEPHEQLTPEMRDGITATIEKAFDREAESQATSVDPPESLHESAQESQQSYWDDALNDSGRFEWASRNEPDLIKIEGDDGEVTGELDEPDADRLRTLAQSDDPKAQWLIADSKFGKDLLLGTDWYGAIDFHDKETMDRFHAYVGKGKS